MPNSGFSKVNVSDDRLFGPRALLLCGFGAKTQSKFISLLSMLGLSGLPLIWATEDQSQETLQTLFQLKDGFGAGRSSSLPRAIIAAGIKERELHHLMTGCRKAGMKQALWATLTPTSDNWPLTRLLKELQAERKALSAKKPPARH